MKTLLGIGGTTCVGKSEVAVNLAKMLGTEIISADSAQIYKGMNVGTAKISSSKMDGIRHHMLDIVEPCESFSSYEYGEKASKIIDGMFSVPIVVGGTGFYFDSLLYPPEFGVVSMERRKQLRKILEQEGLESLCERLKNLDNEAYSRVDLKNPVRVLRALEIAESGQSISSGKGKSDPKYKLILFVLERDRQQLYGAIDKRVDEMVSSGLIDEVRGIVENYGICETAAFFAIGYKEVIDYLSGRATFDEAIAKIKLNTRHYAKRQITYFKKMDVTEFINVDGVTCKQVAEHIYQEYSKICF
ncbi:MAG: tRNA (adenosine(37)-N6)-dimethylallyltransferase MiaA [Corallococcus sp.]|nr:tRNA (adenosine(37)-N6)-dimethylallyltransferase MiaA [Corallococcus sp.]MCM1359171.1 tRNA (adenosine(37)-N6)-dimethylallyltransferase MiaA [Corallococcus sp.]MCM1394561.1 tRNA (adenosine(37)-N6)-dimethylallyltransferase MiaA [Corallococcus sp.]